MKTIVFVCSGNIIRSAFCHIYSKHLGISNIQSFGTIYQNARIHPKTREELIRLGVNPVLIDEFIPTHISHFTFPKDPIFFVMTSEHKSHLVNAGVSAEKIEFITSLIGKQEEVPDPYFTGDYETVWNILTRCIHALSESSIEKSLQAEF